MFVEITTLIHLISYLKYTSVYTIMEYMFSHKKPFLNWVNNLTNKWSPGSYTISLIVPRPVSHWRFVTASEAASCGVCSISGSVSHYMCRKLFRIPGCKLWYCFGFYGSVSDYCFGFLVVNYVTELLFYFWFCFCFFFGFLRLCTKLYVQKIINTILYATVCTDYD
jgi:hypothetical protein